MRARRPVELERGGGGRICGHVRSPCSRTSPPPSSEPAVVSNPIQVGLSAEARWVGVDQSVTQ